MCAGVIDHFVNVDEVVVTSVNDGSHSSGSKHWTGQAFDLRARTIPENAREAIRREFEITLGPDFDILLEDPRDEQGNCHYHVEWHPKR
jgi:hypothetical protein